MSERIVSCEPKMTNAAARPNDRCLARDQKHGQINGQIAYGLLHKISIGSGRQISGDKKHCPKGIWARNFSAKCLIFVVVLLHPQA